MKTKFITLSILSLLSMTSLFAQDRTTVSANSSEISDNLDLRAVASIFGDSRDLADFERRLNDPKTPISNLDLNEDNQVDYLRVIETIEGNAHLIVIQSVLGRDTYQDVATVEVERDSNNRVQVQVVGDVYMYGPNYIYEPVYSFTPVIYTSFWVGGYRPYYSSWYWGYYPAYYYAWSPYPIFRYRNHIGIHINFHHHYNYVTHRRCAVAYNSYYRGGRRGNWYENRYPNRSFQVRNIGYTNRHELDRNRNIRTAGSRELANNTIRNNGAAPRGNANTRTESPRPIRETAPRGNANTRDESPRAIREVTPRGNSNPRTESSPRVESPRTVRVEGSAPRSNPRSFESPRTVNTPSAAPRGNSRSFESPRNSAPREMSSPRGNSGGQREMSSQRGNQSRGDNGNARGNRRS